MRSSQRSFLKAFAGQFHQHWILDHVDTLGQVQLGLPR